MGNNQFIDTVKYKTWLLINGSRLIFMTMMDIDNPETDVLSRRIKEREDEWFLRNNPHIDRAMYYLED